MVLKSKITVSPQTYFVCINEQQQIGGHLISHPYHKGSNLNHTQYPVIKDIHLHFHDLALEPTAQEKLRLRLLLNHLFTVLTTTYYQSISLISVQNSAYITVMRLRPFFFE